MSRGEPNKINTITIKNMEFRTGLSSLIFYNLRQTVPNIYSQILPKTNKQANKQTSRQNKTKQKTIKDFHAVTI